MTEKIKTYAQKKFHYHEHFNDMSLYRDYNRDYVFLCRVLLAMRMVADVTETRNVIFLVWNSKLELRKVIAFLQNLHSYLKNNSETLLY